MLSTFTQDYISNKYVGWLNDPEVTRFSEQRHFHHTRLSCELYLQDIERNGKYLVAIHVGGRSREYHIGNIGIKVDSRNSTADLSIMVGCKLYWRTGVGSRAWCLAISTLFDHFGFRMITAGTMTTNEPMLSLIRRSGMVVDAILPNRFVWEDRLVGLVLASITSKD